MSSKREKILHGALKLFTEKGIYPTSTASIAKEAGVGTGTVFHHFENKDALVKECFIHVKLKLRESLKALSSDDFVEQTRHYWKAAIEWYLENRVEAKFINLYQHDPKINEGKTLQVMTEMSSLIMIFFEKAKKSGILRNFSVDYICLLAHESTILAAQYLVENPEVDRDEFINTTCDFFLEGVLAK